MRVRESTNQYHGFKIVSEHDDDQPENSVHTVFEIQKSGQKTWEKLFHAGDHVGMSRVLRMPCWEEVSQHKTLSDAISAARLKRSQKKIELEEPQDTEGVTDGL